jgi:hypothetical protein
MRERGISTILLLIPVALISIFIGYYFATKPQTTPTLIFPAPTTSTRPVSLSNTPSPLPTAEVTSQKQSMNRPDWNTFTSAKYGFSFQYLKGKRLSELQWGDSPKGDKLDNVGVGIPQSDGVLTFGVYPNPDHMSADKWWDAHFSSLYKDVEINGKPISKSDFAITTKTLGGKTFFYPKIDDFQGISYFIQKDNYIFEVSSTLTDMDEMLSTLNLTN